MHQAPVAIAYQMYMDSWAFVSPNLFRKQV